MKRTKKVAVGLTAAAGLATALTMAIAPSANAAGPTPLVVGGHASCPVGTGFAHLEITSSTGETQATNTTDHIFHYQVTFTTVSATFLKPQLAKAAVICYGPIGNIVVSYDDNIVKLAHPIIGTGWTQNISPS